MNGEKRHWFCLAAGCTVAAVLYSVFAAWRGKDHTPGVGLGWVMAAYGWAVVAWERHKARRGPRR